MHQIEVKKYLVEHRFHPKDGWQVYVDLDAMEMAKGGTHPQGKREAAQRCRLWMENVGVTIGPHPTSGRTDLVAKGTDGHLFLVEVEGDTSRQPEQAMYSALGQTILLIKQNTDSVTYGLAVPGDASWEYQLRKIPAIVLTALRVKLFLVSTSNVRELIPE